jgi:phosphoenolpyruvate phosphomutase
MHSKRKDFSEIDTFMKHWQQRAPVIIVPTNYFTTPTQHFRDIGVSMVIWANHNMRAAVTAMQTVSKQIFQDQSLVHVEKSIAPVKEVFRLQNDKELTEAEEKYLPQ